MDYLVTHKGTVRILPTENGPPVRRTFTALKSIHQLARPLSLANSDPIAKQTQPKPPSEWVDNIRNIISWLTVYYCVVLLYSIGMSKTASKTVRFPVKLLREMKLVAEKERRTVSGEIIFRCQQYSNPTTNKEN